jgi:hypothetical protein
MRLNRGGAGKSPFRMASIASSRATFTPRAKILATTLNKARISPKVALIIWAPLFRPQWRQIKIRAKQTGRIVPTHAFSWSFKGAYNAFWALVATSLPRYGPKVANRAKSLIAARFRHLQDHFPGVRGH